jgi:hypothetical protein
MAGDGGWLDVPRLLERGRDKSWRVEHLRILHPSMTCCARVLLSADSESKTEHPSRLSLLVSPFPRRLDGLMERIDKWLYLEGYLSFRPLPLSAQTLPP